MKFSIITITYNSERYLRETIQSVLSQDYPDREYILVDGGSTDGTLDIIREYAAIDSRIRWISEPDGGIADAMNKGAALATGDLVAHLHSDDYYPDPGVLAAVAGAFARCPDAIWATGGVYLVDAAGKSLDEVKVRRYSYRKLVRGNCILHPATFIRRSAFERVGGFDVAWKYAMDYDLWLRLGELGDPVTIDKPLASFRVHHGGLSSNEADEAFAEELTIRRRLMAGQPLRYFMHYLYFLAKRMRQRHVARRMLRQGR